MAEFAPDAGADLRDLLCGAEAIEPGHEGILQGRRDAHISVLNNRLGQLLDEQRHAIGSCDDLVKQMIWQGSIGDARRHRSSFRAAKSIQSHLCHVAQVRPRWCVLRAVGDDGEDAMAGNHRHDQVE